ncbi:MAG: hypothetical protein ACP5I3_11870, partial [Thermoproteus sp.]
MERYKLPVAKGDFHIWPDQSPVAAVVEGLGVRLFIHQTALAGGIAAVGAPGTGKTVLVSRIVSSAMERLKPPPKLLVFAPKADLAEYLHLEERTVRFWPAAPSKESLFKWNVFLEAYLAERAGVADAGRVFAKFFGALRPQEGQNRGWLEIGTSL